MSKCFTAHPSSFLSLGKSKLETSNVSSRVVSLLTCLNRFVRVNSRKGESRWEPLGSNGEGLLIFLRTDERASCWIGERLCPPPLSREGFSTWASLRHLFQTIHLLWPQTKAPEQCSANTAELCDVLRARPAQEKLPLRTRIRSPPSPAGQRTLVRSQWWTEKMNGLRCALDQPNQEASSEPTLMIHLRSPSHFPPTDEDAWMSSKTFWPAAVTQPLNSPANPARKSKHDVSHGRTHKTKCFQGLKFFEGLTLIDVDRCENEETSDAHH